jgi:NET1-associated nuclear protein 1 (U3 small nucleolar RNA-associated protein 17)
VRCFSTATGAPLGAPLVGHTADVTSVAFHPAHPGGQVLLTASLDGTIRSWNAQDGSAGAVLVAPGPVESMAVPGGRSQHARDVIFLSCWQRRSEEDGAEGGRVHAFSLGKGKSVDKLAKTLVPPPLVASPKGTFLGTFERNTVTVWPLAQRDVGTSLEKRALRLHHTKHVTALAFDVNDGSVAAGDATGRILLWHGFADAVPQRESKETTAVAEPNANANANQNQNRAAPRRADGDALPCTTFHWHAQRVGCLQFTRDGAYLLSGGKEAVLVLWQLETGKKSYLPRLGAEITHLCCFPEDHARVAAAHGDNAIRVVSLASLAVESVARGVRPAPLIRQNPSFFKETARAIVAGNALSTQPPPFVGIDPRSKLVALAASGASLQLFDAAHDAHVADLAVAPRNLVSGDGGPEEPMEPYVSHAAFSHDGSILVTVDRRSERPLPARGGAAHLADAERAPEETLRIWTRDAATDGSLSAERSRGDVEGSEPLRVGFTCVCVCDAPHAGAVTSVSVRGSARLDGGFRAMACTTSADGDAKMWVPSATARGGERAGWRCRSGVTHAGIPPPPLTAGAFSHDGSLYATASEDVVVWEPDTCQKRRAFAPPRFGGAVLRDAETETETKTKTLVSGLAFVAGEPLLAATYPAGLVVWNLATLTAWRVVAMPCLSVAAHPRLPAFAVAVAAGGDAAAVLRFAGRDAHAAGPALVSPGGPPQALLFPEDDTDALLIVTHERRMAYAGGVLKSHSKAIGGGGGFAGAAATRRAGAVAVAGGALRPLDGASLAPHERRLDGTHGGLSAALGASAKAGGNAPWGDLFDAPSHELAPLTTLAPHFLDALLERQASHQ